jgi:cytochrome c oxidase cbb3-type subunit III
MNKIVCISLVLIGHASSAQDLAEPAAPIPAKSISEIIGLPSDPILIALLSFIIALFLVFIFLTRTFRSIDLAIYGKREKIAPSLNWKEVVSTMNETVPVEEEERILTVHEYDGIRELDNNLPLWWRYMFYGTIVFSFIYIFRYHIFKTADLPLAEYKNELVQAELAKEEMRRNMRMLTKLLLHY